MIDPATLSTSSATATSDREAHRDVATAWSVYREQCHQLERVTGKIAAAEQAITNLRKREAVRTQAWWVARYDLGRALLRARIAWPERGAKAKGWGEFLAAQGIEQSTAWRIMQETEVHDAEQLRPRAEALETMPNLPSRPDPKDFMQAGTAHESQRIDGPQPGKLFTSPRAFQLRDGFDLRCGAWHRVLQDAGGRLLDVDALICDPPFGARTHHGSGRGTRSDGHEIDGLSPEYAHWTDEDVRQFVAAWHPHVRGWMACLTSHDLIDAYLQAYESLGRVAFAPVPVICEGASVRLTGDGPSSWACYLMVARTSDHVGWGTLPGGYHGPASADAKRGRGKPRWLMDALIAHYSRPGDLVCDPVAGWATTLHAALDAGRRCVGAEIDPAVHEVAVDRARQPIQSTVAHASTPM